MDPIIGGLITGGANLIGSMFSSDTSAANTQAQIQAQQSMMQQSEAYNTQMSNTAYQRASADMKAAGLNPAMMFSSGGPASSPSVGVPQVPVSQSQGKFSGLGNAVSQGLNAAVNAKTLDKMTEEIANLRTQQAKTAADTAVSQAEVPLLSAKTSTEQSEAVKREAESRSAQLDVPAHAVTAAQANAIGDIPKSWFDTVVKGGFLGGKVNDLMGPIFNSAKALRPWMPQRSTTQTSHDGDDTFTERYSGVGSNW